MGDIFRGRISNILDYGFFVKLDLPRDQSYYRRKEGLVHVSQIRRGQRLNRAQDAGYEQGDKVWVKVTDLREDGKISLSCKEIDQESGKDLNPERT